jgi:hypothetical protein
MAGLSEKIVGPEQARKASTSVLRYGYLTATQH